MTKKPRWKTTVVAVLCLMGLIAVIGGSYAAYTSQTFQRGVVRNRNINTVRFTSNYLQSCANATQANTYANRMIYFQDTDQEKETISFEIEVYNYAVGNTALVSQKDITYNLEIGMNGASGDGYKIAYDGTEKSLNKNASTSVTGRILTGRFANTHTYTITMPGSDLNKVKFTVTATPATAQDLSATNNQKLAAVIAPCIGSTTEQFRAEGKFIYDPQYNPVNYDGFNYEVSISSGAATGTLQWNEEVVEIDKYFLEKLGIEKNGITTNENGYKEITFTLDRTKGTGDYLIPFYIKDREKITNSTWDAMAVYIKFNADPIQSEES